MSEDEVMSSAELRKFLCVIYAIRRLEFPPLNGASDDCEIRLTRRDISFTRSAIRQILVVVATPEV